MASGGAAKSVGDFIRLVVCFKRRTPLALLLATAPVEPPVQVTFRVRVQSVRAG
jgi:hypothetical protein